MVQRFCLSAGFEERRFLFGVRAYVGGRMDCVLFAIISHILYICAQAINIKNGMQFVNIVLALDNKWVQPEIPSLPNL